MFYEIVCLVSVAFLWGATNPFIKRGSKSITKVKADNPVKQFLLELKYLITNIQYIMPMALNQLGSVLYFLTLPNVDLSLSVPVANSLTFVFTGLCGWLLGEKPASKHTYLGMVLILIGTCLCCYDKYLTSNVRSYENTVS
ncbi:hypothetical protein ILUMI_08160 [Ignelater luminosus]|uniref:Transmembrane protein 234 n=1 Tax=Ignelater luminosus TaxID=2038154 RepID=A0A8K0GFP2_IGNLU|nr:hypothetical protein ILUMI_08160 [Ignelater luminosus]